MTRKDFELLARTLRNLKFAGSVTEQRIERRYIAQEFMAALAEAYPSFNRERFMAAAMREE